MAALAHVPAQRGEPDHGLALVLSAGCATAAGKSPYVPTLPTKPVLAARPIVEPCAAGGQPTECVTMLRRDWDAIARWGLEWEREGRAMCLALGRAPGECWTEPR
jgi:hypothetical protein